MRLRLGFYAAPVAIFFLIRVGIRLLAHEAAPPKGANVVVALPDPAKVEHDKNRIDALAHALDASPVTLRQEIDRSTARRDADARLLVFAREANAARQTKAASSAYDAERALLRDDCGGAQTAIARAGDHIGAESMLRESHASAARAIDAFCATMP